VAARLERPIHLHFEGPAYAIDSDHGPSGESPRSKQPDDVWIRTSDLLIVVDSSASGWSTFTGHGGLECIDS
jgi:hypothetical protein